ncbi:MAG: zinc-dependent metalloprotease [Flavobacteriaceae bacterium]|nr:zinc-dependent metalloprotease [Flavobacteriaceae bacterium]
MKNTFNIKIAKNNIIFLLLFSLIFSVEGQDKDKNLTFCTTPATSLNSELYKARIKNTRVLDEYCLKIYVHVIRKTDSTGGQSVSDVNTALGFLDSDFSSHKIYFKWDGVIDYINNSSYFNNPGSNIFNVNNHSDGIDIYLFDDSSSGGGQANGVGNSSEFYVSGSYEGSSLVKSSVISHEMGHVLFLWHTHRGCEPGGNWEPTNGDNCATTGDFICDTPADPHLGFNVDGDCDWNRVSNCVPPEPLSNYNPDAKIIMAYTSPNCMQYFTKGQGERMKNAIATLDHLTSSAIKCRDCKENLSITQNVTSGQVDMQESLNTITASNTIFNTGIAEYNTGNTLFLKPNFHAKYGSTFRGYIQSCDLTKPIPIENKNNIEAEFESVDKSKNIKVYPNPTNNFLTIESSEKIITWELLDVFSKIHFRGDGNESKTKLNMTQLPKGIYILKATLKDGSAVIKKVVKK